MSGGDGAMAIAFLAVVGAAAAVYGYQCGYARGRREWREIAGKWEEAYRLSADTVKTQQGTIATYEGIAACRQL